MNRLQIKRKSKLNRLNTRLTRLNAQLVVTKGNLNKAKLVLEILKVETTIEQLKQVEATIEQLKQKRNTKKQKPVKKEIDFKNWDTLGYEEKAKYLYDGWKKSSDKLDKMNSSLSGSYQHMSRAKASTDTATRYRHAKSVEDNKRGLAILLRDRIKSGLSVDKKYLDAVGSGIDYDQNGNYSPIAF